MLPEALPLNPRWVDTTQPFSDLYQRVSVHQTLSGIIMKLQHMAGLGAVALIVAMSTSGALAQERRYSTGAMPTPTERLQSLPQAPVFRDFLPQAVDLSRYMPAVGDQLNQGSCVGWATAYAARAYYAYQVEHRDIADTANIPSPAWIFNIIHLGNDCNQGSFVPDAMEVLK